MRELRPATGAQSPQARPEHATHQGSPWQLPFLPAKGPPPVGEIERARAEDLREAMPGRPRREQ